MSNNIGVVASNAWYVYNFRKSMIRELASRFDSVHVLVGYDGFEGKLGDLAPNVKVINSSLERKSLGIVSNLKLLMFYLKYYNSHKLDVVMNFTIKPNIFSGAVCKLLNIPYINNVTGLGTVFINKGMVKSLVVLMYKFVFPSARAIIFQNEDDFELIKNEGVKPHNFQLIEGSGVDITALIPSVNNTSDREFDFLFIGRIIKDKGIFEFINASKDILNIFPNAKIGIVGNIDIGNQGHISKSALVKMLDGSSIEYLGFSDDVATILDNTKALVLPSYREGLSRVMIEAASMKCVLLASDVPGCRQVISNKNGITFEARSSDALFEGMIKFLSLSTKEIDEMGERSRELAIKRFSTKVINDKLFKILFAE